jgi:ssDNA-binding Zn-finger/Zn-ribbon topoisomerase 1
MRMPVFYYRMKHTLLAFVARNFTGCAYCNEKKLWKMFGEKCVPLDNFNTLIDSVPVGDDKTKYACYFYPKQRCIEVNRVDENGKYITVESIFVHNCPECGRPLPYMLDSKKKKEKVVIASTPKGPNVFYDMWKKVTGTR